MNFSKFIDLTHALNSSIPTWTGSCGFHDKIQLDYEQCDSQVKFRVQSLKMHAGIGTHMDAPLHCVPGGQDIASIPLEKLIAPCVKIDLSKKAHSQFSASVDDLKEFESSFGKIPDGALVIFYMGWEQYWNHPEKYINDYHYPSISKDVADFLIQRNAVGLAIDTISPDRPEDDFPVHHALLGAEKFIIENIANANLLPETGAFAIALPIKAEALSEAPIRMVGAIPISNLLQSSGFRLYKYYPKLYSLSFPTKF